MATIRGYIAASVDGFITDKAGDVAWLEPFNDTDFGYDRFIQEVGTVVLGRKTYNQSRNLSPDWAYPGKRGIVVTSHPLDDAPDGVSAWSNSIAALADHMRELDGGDVWVVGGAQLQSALFDLNAIDRLELFIIPVLLGGGVPLFAELKDSQHLKLEATESYENGVVRLDYRPGPTSG